MTVTVTVTVATPGPGCTMPDSGSDRPMIPTWSLNLSREMEATAKNLELWPSSQVHRDLGRIVNSAPKMAAVETVRRV